MILEGWFVPFFLAMHSNLITNDLRQLGYFGSHYFCVIYIVDGKRYTNLFAQKKSY